MAELTHCPTILIQSHGSWAHNRSYYHCYAVCECRHVVSNVLKFRQVVIGITLTPVRHQRHMQLLTSAPNFMGVEWPPDLFFPSPCFQYGIAVGWWLRHQSLAGGLPLTCAQNMDDRWPLWVSQLCQLSLPTLQGWYTSRNPCICGLQRWRP